MTTPITATFIEARKMLSDSGGQEENSEDFSEDWKFIFSNGNWNASQLVSQPLFRKALSSHPDRKGFYIKTSRWMKNRDLPQVADVSYTYSNNISSIGQKLTEDNNTVITNPLKRRLITSWFTYKMPKVYEVDVDDKPIVTSCGEPLILQDEESYWAIRCEKNIIALPDALRDSGCFVNKDTVELDGELFNKETLLLSDMTLGPVELENGFIFRKFNYSLYYNPIGWQKTLRNVGRIGFQLKPHPRIPNKFVKELTHLKIGVPPEPIPIPIPLQLKEPYIGVPYPEFLEFNPATKMTELASDPNINPLRMKQIFKEIEMEFWTKRRVNFNGNIPLI